MNAPVSSAGFAEFWRNQTLRALALAYAFIWFAAAIKPRHREDWLLENLLVFLALPVVVALYRRRFLSNASYVLLFIFFALHAVGAHFTYTEMPLGNFFRDHLHWSRNHYDRVVHFAFGLLVTYPVREALVGLGLKGRGLSSVVAVHVVMAWSGLYEVIEGMVAHLVSPELGAAFNGIQGDIWDAQKDMSLALTGALCAMAAALAWEGGQRLTGVRAESARSGEIHPRDAAQD